ncbi:MAG: transcriptional regulator, partial [Phycisphaerae bacterium]|nr:transcriptional regulator [Phycisphaerae bacterium]
DDQRGPLLAILEETVRRHEEMKQNFNRIHEAMTEWQLMVKYLIFDREATARERDELRRKLGNQE